MYAKWINLLCHVCVCSNDNSMVMNIYHGAIRQKKKKKFVCRNLTDPRKTCQLLFFIQIRTKLKKMKKKKSLPIFFFVKQMKYSIYTGFGFGPESSFE